MTDEESDRIAERLSSLTRLQPDAARSQQTRLRVRAALTARKMSRDPLSRFTSAGVDAWLAYGLSVGYVIGMVEGLLRVYLRR